MRAVWLTCLFCCSPSLLAQEAGGNVATSPETRAAEIEAARQRKAGALQPETNSRLEERLIWFEERRKLVRLAGVDGLRLKTGGLVEGGGFAIGPEYLRDDLKEGQVQVRAAAQVSFNGFQEI